MQDDVLECNRGSLSYRGVSYGWLLTQSAFGEKSQETYRFVSFHLSGIIFYIITGCIKVLLCVCEKKGGISSQNKCHWLSASVTDLQILAVVSVPCVLMYVWSLVLISYFVTAKNRLNNNLHLYTTFISLIKTLFFTLNHITVFEKHISPVSLPPWIWIYIIYLLVLFLSTTCPKHRYGIEEKLPVKGRTAWKSP